MTSPYQQRPRHTSSRSQILIVCDDDSIVEQLRKFLEAASFRTERVKSIRAACQFVGSGRFDVVFTVPRLCDGTWQQLLHFARGVDVVSSFVVIARRFDMRDWGETMKCGAFDVLDVVEELPRAADVARQARSKAIPYSLRPNLREPHDRSGFADHGAASRARQKENRT